MSGPLRTYLIVDRDDNGEVHMQFVVADSYDLAAELYHKDNAGVPGKPEIRVYLCPIAEFFARPMAVDWEDTSSRSV